MSSTRSWEAVLWPGVATMEDTSIDERGQAGPTLTHGLNEAKMKIVVVRHTAWSKAEGRCG